MQSTAWWDADFLVFDEGLLTGGCTVRGVSAAACHGACFLHKVVTGVVEKTAPERVDNIKRLELR
jgi:hypothetical protein